MNKPAQRLRLGLVALTLIIAAHPANARAANEMQDAQSASNLTPVIQLDGTATREDTINGTRIVLFGASYETVFTGDPDPKKATARRFPIVYLVALIQTRSTQADQGSKAINPGSSDYRQSGPGRANTQGSFPQSDPSACPGCQPDLCCLQTVFCTLRLKRGATPKAFDNSAQGCRACEATLGLPAQSAQPCQGFNSVCARLHQ